jgi:hypothetical protein
MRILVTVDAASIAARMLAGERRAAERHAGDPCAQGMYLLGWYEEILRDVLAAAGPGLRRLEVHRVFPSTPDPAGLAPSGAEPSKQVIIEGVDATPSKVDR